MKKIGIITIINNSNYGNRLQNYAVQESLKRIVKDCDVITIKNREETNFNQYKFKDIAIFKVKSNVNKIYGILNGKNNITRTHKFKEFNEFLKFSKKKYTSKSNFNEFDYILVGSDQVWNPIYKRLSDVDLLSGLEDKKRISISASFGVKELPENVREKAKEELKRFKAISVREDAGRKIIEDLTDRKDVKVLIDPTMNLTSSDWEKVMKKPANMEAKGYILCYFLGKIDNEKMQTIKKFAESKNLNIINILDPKNPYYKTGPSEFLYLTKNAKLVITDSFHSSVFSILFNRPFIVYVTKRSSGITSRIDTLLKKFKLENRMNLELNDNAFEINYVETNMILEEERKMMNVFLNEAVK